MPVRKHLNDVRQGHAAHTEWEVLRVVPVVGVVVVESWAHVKEVLVVLRRRGHHRLQLVGVLCEVRASPAPTPGNSAFPPGPLGHLSIWAHQYDR